MPALLPIKLFRLEPAQNGKAQLVNTANGAVVPIAGTSLAAQYRFGGQYLVLAHNMSSLDEGMAIYVLSDSAVLDSAETTDIGLSGDPTDIEVIQPDTVYFSFPNHMRWRLRCFARPRVRLHLPTPYMFWDYHRLFRSWFSLRRAN